MFLYKLTHTRRSATLFILALLAVYALMPVLVDSLLLPNPYFVELAQLSIFSCIMIAFGHCLPLLDFRFNKDAKFVAIDSRFFHTVVWAGFVIFLVVTFATADAVPLVSVFKGASSSELSVQRGDFLKTRTGMEAALIYFNTVFVSALLPYSLALLFIKRVRFRYLFLMLFLGYSVSFLQKALFINIIFPLLYITAQQKKLGSLKFLMILIGGFGFLYLITILAFGGESEFNTDRSAALISSDFFGASYLPTSPIDHIIWRIIAVPMFSAADTLAVFNESFLQQPLWGATSSFFSSIFSLEHIFLEKLVFAYQWSWNDIGNTNSVYITEAFVNFGWLGVALFSIFIGQSLRWFRYSRDEAFKSLWLIYCFGLFSGGLIGTLLSNGYLLIFMLGLFFKVTNKPIIQGDIHLKTAET